jgi:hypothetical protein
MSHCPQCSLLTYVSRFSCLTPSANPPALLVRKRSYSSPHVVLRTDRAVANRLGHVLMAGSFRLSVPGRFSTSRPRCLGCYLWLPLPSGSKVGFRLWCFHFLSLSLSLSPLHVLYSVTPRLKCSLRRVDESVVTFSRTSCDLCRPNQTCLYTD